MVLMVENRTLLSQDYPADPTNRNDINMWYLLGLEPRLPSSINSIETTLYSTSGQYSDNPSIGTYVGGPKIRT